MARPKENLVKHTKEHNRHKYTDTVLTWPWCTAACDLDDTLRPAGQSVIVPGKIAGFEDAENEVEQECRNAEGVQRDVHRQPGARIGGVRPLHLGVESVPLESQPQQVGLQQETVIFSLSKHVPYLQQCEEDRVPYGVQRVQTQSKPAAHFDRALLSVKMSWRSK